MLDQALVGSAVTGVLALFAQAVAKCKCFVSCRKDEEGEYCEPRFACGFIDSNLVDIIMQQRKDETPCDRSEAPAA